MRHAIAGQRWLWLCLLMPVISIAGTYAAGDETTAHPAAAAAITRWQNLIEAHGPRAPGQPGNRELEATVMRKFADSGFPSGALHFEAPVFEPGSARLRLADDDAVYRLKPMHPTLMRPGNFENADMHASLVYLGQGRPEDFKRLHGVDLDGGIAVMTFDSGDRWMDAMRFGVRGFIFLPSETYRHSDAVAKVYNSEVAVPRFLASEPAAATLRDRFHDSLSLSASVASEPSRWHAETLRSPWALIPGTDPDDTRDVVLLTAALDANSVTPDLAYGGDTAPNLILLLDLLDAWRRRPPRRSVLLVAVNAHTQAYLGERILAWHLLQRMRDITDIRDLLAQEMRSASVFADYYKRLQLDATFLTHDDITDALNILWALPDDEPPTDPRALHDDVLLRAIDRAIETIDQRLRGMGARMFMDAEQRRETLAERKRLKAWKTGDLDVLRDLLNEAQSIFADERLLETWRTAMDTRTGIRLIVKSRLQDKVQRELNIVKLNQMDLVSDGVEDDGEIERLQKKRESLTRLLILFNKIDFGFGRRRIRYREIAVNATDRAMLDRFRGEVGEELETRMQRFESRLEMDGENGALRAALGTRRVRLAIALGADWSAEQFGFMSLNHMPRRNWQRGFGNLAATIAQTLDPQGGPADSPFVDTLSIAVSEPEESFFADSHTPAGLFQAAGGIPSLTLRSVFSLPRRAFTPRNRIADLDSGALHARYTWMLDFMGELIDAPGLTASDVTPALSVPGDYRLWSCLVRAFEMDEFAAKPTPSLPVRNTMVTAYSRDGSDRLPSIVDGDVSHVVSALGDDTGHALLYGLWESPLAPTAYQLDERRQALVTATIDRGRVQQSRQIDSNLYRSRSKTLPMFRAAEFIIGDRRDVSLIGARPIMVNEYWPISAHSRAEPQKYGVHGADCRSRAMAHRASGPVGVYQEFRVRRASGEPLILMTDDLRFAVNASDAEPEGIGFSEPSALDADYFRQSAYDMNRVSRHRRANMPGIVNELMEEFLDRGQAALDMADDAARRRDHTTYRRKVAVALGNQAKAYDQIRGMNADMLKAIMIYMALMLPFCYFLQKLIFSFNRIEHEMMAFAVMFIITYAGFRLIHPAFSIAMSPEAIFLAFVLGTVGCFVIVMLHNRFSTEMDLLFRGMSGFASAPTSAFVGQTAMIIGVNNMKRRRTRTALTTATIILVVFTMLAFSSVSRKARPTLIPLGDEAPYTGLFYTWPGGATMDEDTPRAFETLYAGRADLLVRRVLRPPSAPGGRNVRWQIERDDRRDVKASVSAALSLSPAEPRFAGAIPFVYGGMFSDDDADEIVLPVTLAAALDIEESDVGRAAIRLWGRRLTVVGVLDEDRYRLLRDLDPRMPLLPRGVTGAPDADGASPLDTGAAVIHDLSMLVFLPSATIRGLGAEPFSVSIRLRDDMVSASDRALWEEADRLLRSTDAAFSMGSVAPFMVGESARQTTPGGVFQVVGGYRTTIGGISRLLIPLLIAGLILFNTMLGTVYERKAEIAVYNAIGLNPRDIFIFFLAEALVYGVIGAIGGYLIGQILAMIAQTHDLVSGMNVNFSSLMVVWAILFTMGLVLLSTLYPAYVATRTAVPSGTRRWGLPEHDGQRMQVELPFIYEPELAVGVMAYLYETLAACVEGSMNEMLVEVRSVHSQPDGGAHPALEAEFGMALAPYDLGVTQSLRVVARFMPELESYNLCLDIRRESGQDTSWTTVNRSMLEQLRKTLLRWRNMDPAHRHEYIAMGRKLFKV